MEGKALEWKGLKTEVRRADIQQQLMSKFIPLCCVRTQEFQGKEMSPALPVALTYLLPFNLLQQPLPVQLRRATPQTAAPLPVSFLSHGAICPNVLHDRADTERDSGFCFFLSN